MKIIRTMVAATLAAGAMTAAVAQDYPTKPVTLVIPYAAGGTTETMARVFSVALGEELGQKVIVQVKPGAGGALGASEVSRAAPDGYTVLFSTASTLMWPPLTQDVDFTLESFDFVAKISDYQQAVVAKADAPFDTMEELIAYSKDNTLSYGDQSSLSRAFIDAVADKEGIQWNGIPTKGGGEMVPFLLGGKIDFAWSGGVHQAYEGKMKVLMSMNYDRLAASPDVPSIQELYGISMPSQAILSVPAGTPAEAIAVLAEKAEAAMENPEFVELMTTKLNFPLAYQGTEAITKAITESNAVLADIAASQ
ncbi:tripartite tricarboxylate transporter substrate binding protein [Pseudooceanicola sp. C21-150M6]|uniref:tripartite tricarboxylate transporter substrate binding protein n=1 Tax=Pseudooceanicola sp. C21-150M6 TaxID=3434355 RepID=UPI003D7F2A06